MLYYICNLARNIQRYRAQNRFSLSTFHKVLTNDVVYILWSMCKTFPRTKWSNKFCLAYLWRKYYPYYTSSDERKNYKGYRQSETIYLYVYYVIFNLNENFLMSPQTIILNNKISPHVMCTAILCALFYILKSFSLNASSEFIFHCYRNRTIIDSSISLNLKKQDICLPFQFAKNLKIHST